PERHIFNNNGLYYKEGDAGTLPPGSVLLAPIEGSAEGRLVIDGSLFGQIVDSPVKLEIQAGKVVDVKGGKAAKRLQDLFSQHGPEATTVAEFGIGTNPKAKLSGIPIEDEKTFGNCYISLGSNVGLGGRVFARTHASAILRKPTILFDKKKIAQGGKFLLGKL
ncbi:MAG TPA: aminopeptidase, partial [archaeon]|nr:aminopeptidase [archaeon]